MSKAKILKNTTNYHDELIGSLKSSKEANLYLSAALEEYQTDNDMKAFLVALRNVAEARGGIGQLSKKTALNRQNLYHILSDKGNPTLSTFALILKDLGYSLEIRPNKLKKISHIKKRKAV